MSEQLLSCPFCGGEAEVEQWGDYRQSHIVRCTMCSCSLEANEEGQWRNERWNARTQQQPATSNDGLRELLQQALDLYAVPNTMTWDTAKSWNDVATKWKQNVKIALSQASDAPAAEMPKDGSEFVVGYNNGQIAFAKYNHLKDDEWEWKVNYATGWHSSVLVNIAWWAPIGPKQSVIGGGYDQ